MLLRSETFKFPTSLPEHSEELFTVEQPLSSPLVELSDSDSPPLMQSGLGQSVDPPAPSHFGNMAKAGKNTVSPSKFYGDGKEDVNKWLRSFERVAKANQWKEEHMAEVLPAVLRDPAEDFARAIQDLTRRSSLDNGCHGTRAIVQGTFSAWVTPPILSTNFSATSSIKHPGQWSECRCIWATRGHACQKE